MASQVSLEYLNNTKKYMTASNDSGTTISVIIGGTAVPLASNQVLNGFTANVVNTQFTVLNSGTYFVMYSVNTVASIGVDCAVYVNGVAKSGLIRNSTLSLRGFEQQGIITLNSGDILQLTLYGLVGMAVLDGIGGANITIVKIS